MKIQNFLISLVFIASNLGFAQNTINQCSNISGVYLNSEDFKMKTMTDSVCLDDVNNKFRIGSIGSIYGNIGGKVKITEGVEKRTYDYDSVFAVLYLGDYFRFEKWVSSSYAVKGVFKIVDRSGLIVYSQNDPDTHNFTRFFYSQGIDSTIKLLSYKNLKKDFPYQNEFLNEIKKNRWALEEKNVKGSYIINEIWNKYN